MSLLSSRRAVSALSLGALFVLVSCSGGGGGSSSIPATQPISPQSVQVGAIAPSPSLTWSPSTSGTFDYGPFASGSTKQTFTLTNSGGAATGNLTITLVVGAGSSGFTVTTDNCSGTSLGPKKTCTVTVMYAFTAGGESDSATLTASGKRAPASASVTLTAKSVTSPQKFIYTGAKQTFVVPFGVTQITVDAVGANGSDSTFNFGGAGEEVVATLPVSSGATLSVYVGGFRGFNGGGSNSLFPFNGGGASDVRVSVDDLNHRVIIAGGGGGAGDDGVGGNAGYANGQTGVCGSPFCSQNGFVGGGGATQSMGGTGGSGGGNGSFGLGGNASTGSDGGGGGGGYYGGGGGGSGSGGGGGGSSNVLSPATLVSDNNRSSGQCNANNNGCITITY